MNRAGNVQNVDQAAASEVHRAQVVELAAAGMTRAQIADRLKLGVAAVNRHYHAALQDFRERKADVVDAFVHDSGVLYARLLRTWLPEAIGYKDVAGAPVPPNLKAANLIAKLVADRAQVLGVARRVEVTGANGGPIVLSPDAIRNLTDDEIERANLILRERGEEALAGYLDRLGAGAAPAGGPAGAHRGPRQTH